VSLPRPAAPATASSDHPGLARYLGTLAAAIAGGALLYLLHVPLAWMIGAMAGTATLGWFRPVAAHPMARPAGLVVLGLALGSSFTGPLLVPAQIALGVLTLRLTLAVPAITVAHQITAALLVAVLAALAVRLWRIAFTLQEHSHG